MFYVYVLENELSDLYFGSTNDLKRRLHEHISDRVPSTKGSGPWSLVYYEAYRSEADARRRESRIKDHGAAKRQLTDRIRESRRAQS
jgi:predicted GIY-YIG superfamily endonuclease